MTDFTNTESFSDEDIEKRKKAIFDAMGKRAQKSILKKGYEKWDPFQEPKDPIEIRKDLSGFTVNQLVNRFFYDYPELEKNNAYRKVVEDMALGVVTDDDRIKASYLFSKWYRKILDESGIEDDWA